MLNCMGRFADSDFSGHPTAERIKGNDAGGRHKPGNKGEVKGRINYPMNIMFSKFGLALKERRSGSGKG